ncbi:MAG: endonuclease NucS [Candidatus Bathyarchaeota archaeon]|nr:endonuclease NucS [Candidatus Bathyarchaeota archaeon]
MYKIKLYFDLQGSYQNRLTMLHGLLEDIKKKWNVSCEETEVRNLSKEEIKNLPSLIRSIPPQVRGRIVSSGHHVLPLSRTKRLNLRNTPITILKIDDAPADVYPHLLGTNYATPEDFISRILRVGPSEYLQARGLLEEPIIKILADYPESLGKGTSLLMISHETEAGVIDIILQDVKGNPIVVETETRAKDSSVAQVCRLAAGYAKSNGLSLEQVRKMIVCLGYEGQLETTCEGSGVELYKLVIYRLV